MPRAAKANIKFMYNAIKRNSNPSFCCAYSFRRQAENVHIEYISLDMPGKLTNIRFIYIFICNQKNFDFALKNSKKTATKTDEAQWGLILCLFGNK